MIKPWVPVGLLKSRLAAGAKAAITASPRVVRNKSLLLENFDHEIADRLGNFLEPVRHSRGDGDDVPLHQVMRLAASDVGAAPLTGLGLLTTDHVTAGYEGRFAVGNVQDIRLFIVNLDLSGGSAVGTRYGVLLGRRQGAALG